MKSEYCLILLLHMEWWQCWCCKVRVARHDIDQRVCLTYKSTHSGLFDGQDTDHSLTSRLVFPKKMEAHICVPLVICIGGSGAGSHSEEDKREARHTLAPPLTIPSSTNVCIFLCLK